MIYRPTCMAALEQPDILFCLTSSAAQRRSPESLKTSSQLRVEDGKADVHQHHVGDEPSHFAGPISRSSRSSTVTRPVMTCLCRGHERSCCLVLIREVMNHHMSTEGFHLTPARCLVGATEKFEAIHPSQKQVESKAATSATFPKVCQYNLNIELGNNDMEDMCSTQVVASSCLHTIWTKVVSYTTEGFILYFP